MSDRVTNQSSPFWSTPRGKAYGFLIHETNSAVGILKNMKKDLSEDHQERIQRQIDKIVHSVDTVFLRLKEMEGL